MLLITSIVITLLVLWIWSRRRNCPAFVRALLLRGAFVLPLLSGSLMSSVSQAQEPLPEETVRIMPTPDAAETLAKAQKLKVRAQKAFRKAQKTNHEAQLKAQEAEKEKQKAEVLAAQAAADRAQAELNRKETQHQSTLQLQAMQQEAIELTTQEVLPQLQGLMQAIQKLQEEGRQSRKLLTGVLLLGGLSVTLLAYLLYQQQKNPLHTSPGRAAKEARPHGAPSSPGMTNFGRQLLGTVERLFLPLAATTLPPPMQGGESTSEPSKDSTEAQNTPLPASIPHEGRLYFLFRDDQDQVIGGEEGRQLAQQLGKLENVPLAILSDRGVLYLVGATEHATGPNESLRRTAMTTLRLLPSASNAKPTSASVPTDAPERKEKKLGQKTASPVTANTFEEERKREGDELLVDDRLSEHRPPRVIQPSAVLMTNPPGKPKTRNDGESAAE